MGWTADLDNKKKQSSLQTSSWSQQIDYYRENPDVFQSRKTNTIQNISIPQPPKKQSLFDTVKVGVSNISKIFQTDVGSFFRKKDEDKTMTAKTSQVLSEFTSKGKPTQPKSLFIDNKVSGESANFTDSIRQSKQFKQRQQQIETPARQFIAGVGDMIYISGRAASWLGQDGIGTRLAHKGEALQKVAVPDDLGQFNWHMLYDPKFYAVRVTRQLPFSLSLLPVSIIGGYAGATTATAIGLGAFGRVVLGSIGAGVLTRPFEAALEAGQTFDESIKKGKTVDQANDAANKTFLGNLSLTSLDALEFFTAFAPIKGGGKFTKLLLRAGAIGGSISMEGAEELIQRNISRTSQGERIDITSPEAQEEFASGGLMGLGLGISGAIYSRIKTSVFEQSQTAREVYQENLEAGMSSEVAELTALDTLTEKNPEAMQAIVKNTLDQLMPSEKAFVSVEQIQSLIASGDEQSARTLFDNNKNVFKNVSFDTLVTEVEDSLALQIDEVKREIEETKETLKATDDPDGVLASVAEKIANHFKAPLAKRKITGKERTHRITDPFGTEKSLTVGGNATEAFDRIFYSTDIEGFKNAIEVLAGKFDKSFTEIYNKIQKGDIDGANYETFKSEFTKQLESGGKPARTRPSAQPVITEARTGAEPRPKTPDSGVQSQPSVDVDDLPFSDTSSADFADKGNYGTVQSAEKIVENIRSVEFPELVRLARDLSGSYPSIQKLRTSLGLFRPKTGTISLNEEIFKNTGLAAKVLAHELGHLTDYIPDKSMTRGNLAGRIASLKSHLKDLYSDQNGSISNKEVRKELMNLTHLWKPFDPKQNVNYTKYRYSSAELYADAVSVLFNDPALLKEKAPIFWKGFFDYIDKKPEVKENYFALQDLLNKGEEAVLSEREKQIREMFKRGEDLNRALLEEKNMKKKDFIFRMKYELIDKNQAIIDHVEQLKKEGKPVSDEDNPVHWLDSYNYVGGVLKYYMERNIQPIYKSIIDNGITWEDLGEALFLERVIHERGDLANPLGFDPQTAQSQLEHLQTVLGDAKWTILQEQLKKYRDSIKSVLDLALEAGIYKPEVVKELKTNPAYATYQVLDYLDDYIPPSIKKQMGTLKEISNPATATVQKTMGLLRAIERNTVKSKIIDFLKTSYSKEIQPAKTIYNGKAQMPIEPKDDALALFTVMEKGELKGYYVDPYIASTMEYMGTGHVNAVLATLQFLNSRIFRPTFITFNIGFQSFNAVRDFMRFYKNTPNLSLLQAVKTYKGALFPSFARAFGLKHETIAEMERSKILSLTLNDLIQGRSEEDTQIEYLLEKVGISAYNSKKYNALVKPFVQVLDIIEKTGNFIETLPKVAAYQYLDGKLPTQELASFIRTSAGSPDFMRKGAGYAWYNNIFLFSNAIKEGVRADFNVAFSNPKTRSGYWWKTAWTTILPKVIMYSALLGLFGPKLKDMMEDVSEYDKTNYVILPLTKKDGKTLYLRIPQDETGRFIGGFIWKTLNSLQEKKLSIKDAQELLSFTAGQIPTVSPALVTISAITQYLTGNNPYDFFRQRNVIPDTEFKAGPKYSYKPFIMWLFNTAGGGILWKSYINEQSPDSRQWYQKILEAPVLSNIVGRWLKVSSYGKLETNRDIINQQEQFSAENQIKERELLKKYLLDYNKGQKSDFRLREAEKEFIHAALKLRADTEDKTRIRTNLSKKFRIAVKKGEEDPNLNALIEANTNQEKITLLKSMESNLSSDAYNRIIKEALEHKIISSNISKLIK